MVKIRSVCDNINNDKRLWSVEGSCILAEVDGLRILYDVCREYDILEHNLGLMNLTLDDIDFIVLSHGHKGHSGAVLDPRFSSRATVLYGSGLGVPKYKGAEKKPVNNQKIYDRARSFNCEEVRDMRKISQSVVAFKSQKVDSGSLNGKYLKCVNGEYSTDDFYEELNLAVKTDGGIMVITGCAHRGLDGIIESAINACGGGKVKMLIGGTHIKDDRAKLENFKRIVEKYGVEYIAPSHCTGYKAVAELGAIYGERFLEFNTGKEINA